MKYEGNEEENIAKISEERKKEVTNEQREKKGDR